MKEIVVIPASIDNKIFGNKNKILRVASYSRVSTNFEEQLSSFHLQKSYYTDLILKTKGWTLAGTYADEGISGTTEDKRPGFQKLMNHCRKGKIDLIITKSLSRFSRNLVITLNRVRELKSMGIGVYFEKENINTLEENSELLLTILASLAQEESYSISMNVKKGKQMAIKEGRVTWNYKNNYGYRKGEDGNPEIIPEHAEIIKKIYKYYLKGESDSRITKLLNEEKILSLNKKEWKTSTIQRILTNERYCGDVILQKTYVENHITKKVKINNGELPKVHIKNNHKEIISREVFEEAMAERAKRKTKTKSRKNSITENGKYSSKYALSSMLICAHCLSPYRRVVWTVKTKDENGNIIKVKRPVWRCSQRLDYGKQYCTHSKTLDENDLHKNIMEQIEILATSEINIDERIKEELELTLYSNHKEDFDIESAQKRIAEITEKIMTMVASGNVSENIFIMKSMNEEAMQLQSIIEKYKANNAKKRVSDKLNEVGEYLNDVKLHEYDDVMVRQIVDSIYVKDKEKIELRFKKKVGTQIENC